LLIDVPGDEARAAATFWGAALGVSATPDESEEQYTSLAGALPHVAVAVQALESGEARYHLDIETDDVAAETARLVGLGAVEVGSWLECRTLRVPGGLLICVVPAHSQDFEQYARTWA
jgi:hypothetical protein